MQLSEIQARFKAEMLSPAGDALDDMFESGPITLDERLQLYRSNIIGSLTDVMKANYPIIETLVGEDFFKGCARHFIQQHPPEGGCLNNYGDGFADFLAGFEPANSLPYLPDVARYEWAKQAAYYAVDDEPLTAKDLSKIAPESLADLHLKLRGHVHLISSRYPLITIDEFCCANTEDDQKLDLDQGGDFIMIARPHLKVEILALEERSYDMLTQLSNGAALGQAVEHVLSKHESFDFQAFLQTHIARESFLSLNANI